jgi:hypothetical protein
VRIAAEIAEWRQKEIISQNGNDQNIHNRLDRFEMFKIPVFQSRKLVPSTRVFNAMFYYNDGISYYGFATLLDNIFYLPVLKETMIRSGFSIHCYYLSNYATKGYKGRKQTS